MKIKDLEKEKLLKIQKIDLEILKLVSSAQTLPQSKKAVLLRDILLKSEQNLAKIDYTEKIARGQANQITLQLNQQTLALKKAELKIKEGTSSAKVAEQLQKDLEAAELKLKELEQKHVDKIKQLERISDIYSKQKNIAEKTEGREKKQLTSLNQASLAINEELQKLKIQKNDLAMKIKPEILDLYKEIFEKKKDKIIVEVYQNDILGVDVSLSQGEIETLRKSPNDELVLLDDYGVIALKFDKKIKKDE